MEELSRVKKTRRESDFIKADGGTHPYEAGRLAVSRHLELLNGFGYREVMPAFKRWLETDGTKHLSAAMRVEVHSGIGFLLAQPGYSFRAVHLSKSRTTQRHP